MYIMKKFGIGVLTVFKESPFPQEMFTTKTPIVRGDGGGKDCIVKRMHNFACTFAKVSQDVWIVVCVAGV